MSPEVIESQLASTDVPVDAMEEDCLCGMPEAVDDPDEHEVPDESWDEERLTGYATDHLNESQELEDQACQISKNSTVQLYRAGRALWLLHRIHTANRTWCRWLEAHNIPRTNAYEAIKLFEEAGSEDAVAGLTRTEAKRKFRITAPPREEEDGESDTPAQEPGNTVGTVDPTPESAVEASAGCGEAEHSTAAAPLTPEPAVGSLESALMEISLRLDGLAEHARNAPDPTSCRTVLGHIRSAVDRVEQLLPEASR